MRKDDFDEFNISLEDYLVKVFEFFWLFIKKCGGRVVVFNNKLKGSESVL